MAASAPAKQSPQTDKHITFNTVDTQCDYCSTIAEKLYTEAFSKLGYTFDLEIIPGQRALEEINSGRHDGGAVIKRLNEKQKARYPNLLIVDEKVANLSVAAYSVLKIAPLSGWDELKETDYIVGYPDGFLYIEEHLPASVDSKHRVHIYSTTHGLEMLFQGRIDVYVGHENSADRILTTKEFAERGISKLGIMGIIPLFPYLNSKHRALVPKLARVLQEMKTDGSYARIVTEGKKIHGVTFSLKVELSTP